MATYSRELPLEVALRVTSLHTASAAGDLVRGSDDTPAFALRVTSGEEESASVTADAGVLLCELEFAGPGLVSAQFFIRQAGKDLIRLALVGREGDAEVVRSTLMFLLDRDKIVLAGPRRKRGGKENAIQVVDMSRSAPLVAGDLYTASPNISVTSINISSERTGEFAAEAEAGAAAPDTPDAPPAANTYRVWYGTNRRLAGITNGVPDYTGEFDKNVHHGWCDVHFPESRKIGSTGSSWLWRFLTGNDDRLTLAVGEELAEALFWKQLQELHAAQDPEERQAVIFLHGYNVSFQNAAIRAAQIGFDLKVPGAMAFFSWPSRGAIGEYLADEDSIMLSEGAIAEFLSGFASQSGATRVHVIAHSMGNRGLLRAAQSIVAKARETSPFKLGQLILAAADVNREQFLQLASVYRDMALRTTLYVSDKDLALDLASWLHNFVRAGFAPPITILPHVDTVHVANVDLSLLGHSVFATQREVLSDMHELIRSNAPPNQRLGLRKMTGPDGVYWTISA